jgi:hypothetical protein
MESHLGHGKHETVANPTGNTRNGVSHKTLKGEFGEVHLQIPLTLVANKLLYCPPSKVIRALQVPAGFDVAESKIVEMVALGDLVITADIPLAAEVIARGGHVLNLRFQSGRLN